MAAEAKIYTRLKLDPADFAKKLGLSEAQMKKFTQLIEKEVIRQEKAMKRASKSGWGAGALKSAITSATTSMLGMTAAVAGVSAAFRDAVTTSMAFERSLSGLSALTGATGEDLEFIRRTAIALSAQSELSARDVVEAMKLIGGQRPELLEAADGLAAVTRATITLAEASEGSMEDSARAVTGALGQFGKGAEYASTFVNVLAAGAKEGAAEIPYLQQAVEKSGSAASAAGLSFEQLVAVIEGVAPRFTRAEEAGTSLRAIFTKLEGQTNDKLKPSVVGIHQALANLAEQELSTAQLTKMFGLENINMARALLDARTNIQQLEGAVTGTHVAEEQAAVTTDNLAGAVKELSNAWDAFVLSLNRSDGALAKTTRGLAEMVNWIRRAFNSPNENARDVLDQRQSDAVARANEQLVDLQNRHPGGTRTQAINTLIGRYTKVANDAAKSYNRLAGYVSELRQKRANSTIAPDEHAWLSAWEDYKSSGDSPLTSSGWLNAMRSLNRYGEKLGGVAAQWHEFIQAGENAKVNKGVVDYLKQLRSSTPVKTTDTGGTGGSGAASASSASTKTSAAAMKRERAARLRALEQLGEAVERAQAKQAENEVAAMQEGHSKRLAEIRLEWREELAEIDKQQAEAAKAAKDGGLGGLTPEQTAVFDALREQANAKSLQATREELAAERQARQEAYEQMLADRAAYYQQQAEQEQQLRETLRGSLEGALGGVTGLLGQVDTGWAQTVTRFISGGMQVVQSVLQIIQSIQTLTQTLQTMRAVSSIGSMLSPATGLLGGGGVFGAILQRGGVVDGYAGGGVFRGGRTTGDHVLARVNAGEMVLTRNDQSRLLAMMRSGGATGGGTTTVRGEDIYLALSAYQRRTGRRLPL